MRGREGVRVWGSGGKKYERSRERERGSGRGVCERRGLIKSKNYSQRCLVYARKWKSWSGCDRAHRKHSATTVVVHAWVRGARYVSGD